MYAVVDVHTKLYKKTQKHAHFCIQQPLTLCEIKDILGHKCCPQNVLDIGMPSITSIYFKLLVQFPHELSNLTDDDILHQQRRMHNSISFGEQIIWVLPWDICSNTYKSQMFKYYYHLHKVRDWNSLIGHTLKHMKAYFRSLQNSSTFDNKNIVIYYERCSNTFNFQLQWKQKMHEPWSKNVFECPLKKKRRLNFNGFVGSSSSGNTHTHLITHTSKCTSRTNINKKQHSIPPLINCISDRYKHSTQEIYAKCAEKSVSLVADVPAVGLSSEDYEVAKTLLNFRFACIDEQRERQKLLVADAVNAVGDESAHINIRLPKTIYKPNQFCVLYVYVQHVYILMCVILLHTNMSNNKYKFVPKYFFAHNMHMIFLMLFY